MATLIMEEGDYSVSSSSTPVSSSSFAASSFKGFWTLLLAVKLCVHEWSRSSIFATKEQDNMIEGKGGRTAKYESIEERGKLLGSLSAAALTSSLGSVQRTDR